MADNEAAVPKFGEWDDKDAKAPDNYTAIFNQVREGRQDPRTRASTQSQSTDSTNNQNHEQNQKKCCCFPWPRK